MTSIGLFRFIGLYVRIYLVRDGSGLRGHEWRTSRWTQNGVWLTGKGGGVKEQENREKKGNIKSWGRGEIAVIKNSRDTFLSQGSWAIFSKRKYKSSSNKDLYFKVSLYFYLCTEYHGGGVGTLASCLECCGFKSRLEDWYFAVLLSPSSQSGPGILSQDGMLPQIFNS